MPAERVSMRQAREIIRLKFSVSLPTREIARRLGLAPSTVPDTGPSRPFGKSRKRGRDTRGDSRGVNAVRAVYRPIWAALANGVY